MRGTEAVDEARRMLGICNACRYCEGYCAVFPAMELRRSFTDADVSYLANLCHDCRGCYFACQYAPPHEFQLNLPQIFSRVRRETYAEYAWPRPLGAAFRRNGTFISVLAALAIALVLFLTMKLHSPGFVFQRHTGPGAFYAVIPEPVMLAVAGATFGFALLAMGIGFLRFWRGTGSGQVAAPPGAPKRGLRDIFTLRNLGGGGYGCNDINEAFSQTRRYFHHALFYGFLLTFASTCTAAIYEHLLARLAPYPFFSLPVLFGTVGGIGILIGCGGLFTLKLVRDQRPVAKDFMGADYALLALLFFSAATGLLLLGLRGTAMMSLLLALHLGFILALFLALPYSKFVHGIYRSAALLSNSAERPRP